MQKRDNGDGKTFFVFVLVCSLYNHMNLTIEVEVRGLKIRAGVLLLCCHCFATAIVCIAPLQLKLSEWGGFEVFQASCIKETKRKHFGTFNIRLKQMVKAHLCRISFFQINPETIVQEQGCVSHYNEPEHDLI